MDSFIRLAIIAIALAVATPHLSAQEQQQEEDLPGADDFVRARYYEKAEKFKLAAEALERCVVAGAANPEIIHRMGVNRFYAGEVTQAVKDFDRYLRKVPGDVPHLWQRGIALYYAKHFSEGMRQFEQHQTVNAVDSENAIWHFLCNAQINGIAAARKNLYPFDPKDRRVPMKEVYAMFAGTGTVEAVLEAAQKEDSDIKRKNNFLFYAHLYIGLFYEVSGNAKDSLHHIQLAAETYFADHYMGRVAKIHLALRKRGE